MKTPFTSAQFFDVFKDYNESVFPSQVFFYFLAILIVYFVFRNSGFGNKFINRSLGFFWIWMGVVYHFTFFLSINPAAYIFGSGFILQGFLFLISGSLQRKLSYGFQKNSYGIAGLTFVFYSLVVYPLLGYMNGHVYPYSPTFGLPCPTTIFTLGILLMSDKKIPVSLLIIPVLWSLVGFTAVINFGILEDTGLLIAGIISFVLILIKNKRKVQTQLS